jgi:molecular chaperone GrpE
MTRIPIVDKRSASRPDVPERPPAAAAAEAASGAAAEPCAETAADDPQDGRLAAAEAAREEWRQRALRLAADLENLRKVVDQRVDNEVFRREQERLVRWLELGDALDRALRQSASAPAEWRRGLEDVVRTFDDLLARSGVVRLEITGPFDPAWHEAVAVTPDPGRPDGAIAAVERAGWKLGDRLLRPAGVVVVRNGGT